MLTGAVLRAAFRLPAEVPRDLPGLAATLRRPPPPPPDGWWRTTEPTCPARVKAADWRRASRLARLALEVVDELHAAAPHLDWTHLPMVYGSAMGEVVPSTQFLERLFAEGPAFASPFAFQNSVYNATSGHVSQLYGLRGPTETLSAGMATGLFALARGLEWLESAPTVLVLVGDDLNRTTEAALGTGGGEAVVGVLVGPGQDLLVRDGVHESEVSRATALPYEEGFEALGYPVAPERTLGLCCTNGLVALLAGLSVVDQDSGTAISGSSRPSTRRTTA